nr:CrcB family protein [Synechococcus sp. UW140]
MEAKTSRFTLQQELSELVLVAIGAVPGAVLRWQLGLHLGEKDLVANVVGALVLGLLAGCPSRPRRQLLLGIGFCGSLTTFSSWMVNSVELIASGQWVEALGLIGLTLGLGVGAAALGFWVGRALTAPAPTR